MSVNRAARSPSPHRWLPVGAGVLLALSLAACGNKDGGGAPGAAAQGGMPPPEVGVVAVQPGSVTLTTELPGRLEAARVAQVRARAAGILQKRLFSEGSDVKAGQQLFAIDPAPYNAALQSAQANVARALASQTQAAALVERYKPLVAANAVSKQEYANAVAAKAQADADVLAARAAVQTARINLGYASVTAPISGRIGRALVTEGALVGQGEPTQLAVIQQINPLYVNITQSAGEVMKLRQALQSGKLARANGSEAAKVQVVLEDGSLYGSAGKLLFSDLSVDPATGQVSLRAEVPNPQGLLLPGMYVRARIQQARVNNAILLPQQAVTRGSKGDSVLVVAPDGSFAPRLVKVGEAQGGSWVIHEGLQPGDQVIVEGVMKLMPGVKTVKAVPWTGGSAPAAGGAAPAPQAPSSGAPAAQAPASAASQ